MTWRCAHCGDEHEGLATVFGPSAPDAWVAASQTPGGADGEINRDMCVLKSDDTTHFFVRGELPIPVVDADIGPFVWSVWTSLSETSMRASAEHWDDPDRAALPPMFGWLSNRLFVYRPPTLGLALHVQTRAPGVVPWFELDPALDHPLVHEQRDGITVHRVAELNRRLVDGRP